ncbi:MAG: MFS transporter [Pseudomonadota bacterium]|nr:MFS transporter [Pseudomonadota bacterium]
MTATATEPADGRTVRMSARAKGALLVLCSAIFLEGIDIAMLNVALPSIRAELGLSTTMLSAVVSAYVIGYAGFMLLGGRIADLFGRRRVFLAALSVFLVFSGLGGFATEGWMLITARFVTGLAAAFMTPAGLSLITTNFPEGPLRNKAILIYAGTAAAGFSLGLVAGGFLTAISWRWVFFAPVILTALILCLVPRLIVDQAPPPERRKFDFLGAILMTSAMLSATFGVTQLERPDEITVALWSFALSLVLWAAFLIVERNTAVPLLRLGIFRSPALVRTNTATLLFAGSLFGFQFLVTLYLQEVMNWTPVETSFALLLMGVDAILAPTLTPWLVSKLGNVKVIFGGLVLAVVGYALFLGMGLDWTYAAMFPSMLALGMAFALAYGPLTIAATDGIEAEEQGLASSLVNTAFQFGAALGLSAVSALVVYNLGLEDHPEARIEALRTALLIPVAAATLAALIMMTGFGRRAA